MKRFETLSKSAIHALAFTFACNAVAIPFNDKVEFAAELGSAPRLHRMSDPRVATTDPFEEVLGMADSFAPLVQRTGSLWFKWTAPAAGTYFVAGLDHSDLMDVYRVSAGMPGSHIQYSSGNSRIISFNAMAGEQLFIRHMGRNDFFSNDSSPVGFLLRQIQSSHVTDFGSRSSISGKLTGFGVGNVESYKWTVPKGGTHRIRIDLDEVPTGAYDIGLKRNGVELPDFDLNLYKNIVLSTGDLVEIVLNGNVRFCRLNFGPVKPSSSDLGSVMLTVVPGRSQFGNVWNWTAPASGFLRLDLESQTPFDPSFFGGSSLVYGKKFGFDFQTVDVTDSDSDCDTLGYKVALVAKVESGVTYEFSDQNFANADPASYISLKFTSIPTSMSERLDAATASLDLGTDVGLADADAHLAAALAMDVSHPVANALRAITRLALLERDPAFAAFLQSLSITNAGTGLFDSSYALTEAPDGLPVFPAGVKATGRIAALNALFSPRFKEIRGYLDAAAGGDDRRLYLGSTGSFVLDEADILAMKACINLFESLLDLLSIYDLGGSMNAIVQLERDGVLDLERALAEFPSLLTFANSAAIAEFKSRISAANTQLCAALVMSAGNRVVCGKHPFPPFGSASGGADFIDHLTGLDEITKAFAGPVDIGGETVDLSKWNVSAESLRNMLPDISGNQAIGFSAPDPTLGGIFPKADAANSPIEGILGFADPAGFSFWIHSFVSNGLPPFLAGTEDDADGDGDSNGKEYFFASNPNDKTVVTQAPVSAIRSINGGQRYRVSFVRRIGAVDVRYVVAVSNDLVGWDYSEGEVTVVGTPVPVGDGQGEIVTVEIGSGISGSKFVRVHAAAK